MVRQAGGGAFLMFENRMPAGNWLQVVLRGTQSNRRGIGARVVAHTDGGKVVRELFPANSFASQGPGYLHFGLGKSQRVSRLEVRWPSGETQTFPDVPANQRIQVTEGSGEWVRLRGGR